MYTANCDVFIASNSVIVSLAASSGVRTASRLYTKNYETSTEYVITNT